MKLVRIVALLVAVLAIPLAVAGCQTDGTGGASSSGSTSSSGGY